MESMRGFVLEFWDHYVLMQYQTMLIRAESKRRKALTHAQDDSHKFRKANLFCDQNSSESNEVDERRAATDISSSMPICDRAEMRRVFDLFDENKDERISAEELQQFMKRLGFELSDQQVKEMVGAVDQNRDDCVDFEEFFSLYSSLRAMGEPDGHFHRTKSLREGGDDDDDGSLLRAFSVFDENKDGLISAAELQQVLLKLGLPEGRSLMSCKKMIECVDTDGKGKVDFFDFKDMMCSDAFRASICKL